MKQTLERTRLQRQAKPRMARLRLAAAAWTLTALWALPQTGLPAPPQTFTVQAHPFTGGSGREDSMWSALYAAASGRLYIGLCTHAEAAHFYEFDPATQTMRHVADLTQFKGERGQGIRTSGKIHVRMGEDAAGRIYFGDFCEDTGPECVDPASYRGPHWYHRDLPPGQLRSDRARGVSRLGRAGGRPQPVLRQAGRPVRRDGDRSGWHHLHWRKRPPGQSVPVPARRPGISRGLESE